MAVIDIESGNLVNWLRIDNVGGELGDVTLIEGARRPGAVHTVEHDKRHSQKAKAKYQSPIHRRGVWPMWAFTIMTWIKEALANADLR